jgi:hypothetical protein
MPNLVEPILEPPYWAVVFTSIRTADDAGYGATAVEREHRFGDDACGAPDD